MRYLREICIEFVGVEAPVPEYFCDRPPSILALHTAEEIERTFGFVGFTSALAVEIRVPSLESQGSPSTSPIKRLQLSRMQGPWITYPKRGVYFAVFVFSATVHARKD